jgi:hypothetical protein
MCFGEGEDYLSYSRLAAFINVDLPARQQDMKNCLSVCRQDKQDKFEQQDN